VAIILLVLALGMFDSDAYKLGVGGHQMAIIDDV